MGERVKEREREREKRDSLFGFVVGVVVTQKKTKPKKSISLYNLMSHHILILKRTTWSIINS